MGTRALQLDILLSGLRDPDTNAPLAGGVVYFYAAGTTTAKNVWSEKAKTNAFTFLTLDSNGSVASPYYGDGWYKIVVKDSAAAIEYTWDQVYLQSNSFSVVQKSGTYTATPDDDIIICVSGTWTLSLQTVADFEHPLDIVNVGTGTITIDPSSTQTIGGSATLTLAPGQRIRIVPDTTSTTWRRVDFSTDLNGSEFLLDADGDTSITADTDDVIDFKINGTDTYQMSAASFKADVIAEKTSAAGVTIDGVRLKDDTIKPAGTHLDIDVGGTAQVSFKDGYIDPITTNDIDIGSNLLRFNNIVFNGSLYAPATSGGALVIQGKDVTVAIHRKVVEIGDWNMDSTGNVDVAHGLTLSKIRNAYGCLRNDDGTAHYGIVWGAGSSTTDRIEPRIYEINATNIRLLREGTSPFDGTDFDATSYNRGWITIDYVD